MPTLLSRPLTRRDDPPPPSRPAEVNNPHHNDHHTASIIGPIIGVVILLFLAFAAFYAYRYYRSRRLGLPPPTLNPFTSQSRVSTRNYPAQGGIVGWLQSTFRNVRNRRTAGGAYEGTSGSGGRAGRARGGLGALDPDEAWDSRVGNEADGYGGRGGAYHEEQELGLTNPRHTGRDSLGDVEPYAGGGYGRVREDTGYGPSRGLDEIMPGESERGARGDRELDERHEEETGRSTRNPFGDHAERSDIGIRAVSPRPTVETHAQGHGKTGSKDDFSPTERRSVFRENV